MPHGAVSPASSTDERASSRPTGASLDPPFPSARAAQIATLRSLSDGLETRLAEARPAPAAEARVRGRAWGQALASGESPQPSPLAARQRVITLLEELGFAPQTDQRCRTVLLRGCPTSGAGGRHPGNACEFHASLFAAVLGALSADEDGRQVALQPLAVPDACVLHLGPATVIRLYPPSDAQGS